MRQIVRYAIVVLASMLAIGGTVSLTPVVQTSFAAGVCVGSPLTSQSQVKANTTYCGGTVHSQITLAVNDKWQGGEVTGATTQNRTQGVLQFNSGDTLINMHIHDNPTAWAGIYATPNTTITHVLIQGGRVTNSGNLGIGGGATTYLTISGVQVDHNGQNANCGDEGGGFKSISIHTRITGSNFHDNNCVGIWFDINAYDNQIDHNTITNNADGGIFYEISQNSSIHDNNVTGNGYGNGGCTWLWNGGITLASSFNMQVYNNTLTNNCNGLTGTQQTRNDSTPPAHLLQNDSFYNNTVIGGGKSGWVADNGANLQTRNLTFVNNTFSGGANYCAFSC